MGFREPLLLHRPGARPARARRLRGGAAAPPALRRALHERRRAGRRGAARAGCATCRRCSRCSRSPRCWSRSRARERTVAAERREATVVMVTDTSGSMLATDVGPEPADGRAREAARTLLEQRAARLPARPRVVRLDRRAARGADHRPQRACSPRRGPRSRCAGATAMGDGLALGLDAARVPVPDGLGGTRRLPARARAALRRRQHPRRRPDRRRPARQAPAGARLHRRARHARPACWRRPRRDRQP